MKSQLKQSLVLFFLLTCHVWSEVPEIPEPLIFDLMRPLHAKAGELEINTLAVFGHRSKATWAPEVEFALADGIAIEFEFPFEGAEHVSNKLGLQFRLGYNEKSVHGLQLLGEKATRGGETQLNALYIFGHRFNERWSLNSMSGVRHTSGTHHENGWEGLQNLTLFHNTTSKIVTGLEMNWAFNGDSLIRELTVIPQAHLNWSEHFALQLGVGAQRSHNSDWNSIYGARAVVSW